MVSPRKAWAIFAGVVAVVVIAAGVGYANAGAPTAGVTADASAAPVPPAPPLTTAEQAFWNHITNTSDLEGRGQDVIVKVGHDICANIGIPGVDRLRLMGIIQQARWSIADSAKLLVAAEAKLCPERLYAPTVVVTTPATPAVPSGPAKVISSDSTFEVGVQIAAGKWTAPGISGEKCYWKLMAPETRKIIENHYAAGGDTVWIKAGELFQVQDCGTWTWVGDK